MPIRPGKITAQPSDLKSLCKIGSLRIVRTSSRHTIGGNSRVLCQLGKAKLLDVRPYEKADESRVVAIWKACGLVVPWNDPVKDIARKLWHSPDSFLVGLCQGEIVATVMFGYDGHRGSVNHLAVTPSHQNRGLARDLMRVAVQDRKYAGLYIYGPEVDAFRPCGDSTVYWVSHGWGSINDELRAFHEQSTSEPYQEIYIEFVGHPHHERSDGFAGGYDGILHISQMLTQNASVPKNCK